MVWVILEKEKMFLIFLGNKTVIFFFNKKHTGHRMQKILRDHSGAVNVLVQGMTLAVKV